MSKWRNESQSGGTWSEDESKRSLVAGMFTDVTVLLAKNEGMLHRIVDKFDRVCKKRKKPVKARRSKVMVFRTREQVTDFAKPYSQSRGYNKG